MRTNIVNIRFPFISCPLVGLISAAMVGGYFPAVKAQSSDEAAMRIIERPTNGPFGGFTQMVTSDDGQIVALYAAGSIGAPGLPSLTQHLQVIVIDRRTGTVELASRTPSGGFQNTSTPPGQPFSVLDGGPLSISRDGRYIAFLSSATNLDPQASTPGAYTYLYDRQTQQVRALTADNQLRPGWRGGAGLIDGSGEKLFFPCRTLAGLPIVGPEFALCERRLDNFSVRVIRSGLISDDARTNFIPSRDGRKIAFTSQGPILTSGASNPNSFTQLYLIDTASGELELISKAPDGSPGDGFSGGPDSFSLSDDADFIAFSTSANNIAPGVAPPGSKILVIQRSTGITRRTGSVNPLAVMAPHLSGDGRRLVYLDYAFLGSRDIIRVYDWETNSNRAVAVPVGQLPNDLPCGSEVFFPRPPESYWLKVAISADGRSLVFNSRASNFFPGDEPGSCDLFAQRLGPVPQPALPVPGPAGPMLVLLAALVIMLGLLTLRRSG